MVLTGMLVLLLALVGWFIYDLIAPLVIIIQKGLGLKMIRQRPKGGKWEIDGNIYVLDTKGAMPDRGLFFFRSIYCFDEGCPKGRLLTFKGTKDLDGNSLKRLIDKDYINGVVTSMMGLLDSKKVMFYLLILVAISVINLMVVGVVLMKDLGILTGTTP